MSSSFSKWMNGSRGKHNSTTDKGLIIIGLLVVVAIFIFLLIRYIRGSPENAEDIFAKPKRSRKRKDKSKHHKSGSDDSSDSDNGRRRSRGIRYDAADTSDRPRGAQSAPTTTGSGTSPVSPPTGTASRGGGGGGDSGSTTSSPARKAPTPIARYPVGSVSGAKSATLGSNPRTIVAGGKGSKGGKGGTGTRGASAGSAGRSATPPGGAPVGTVSSTIRGGPVGASLAATVKQRGLVKGSSSRGRGGACGSGDCPVESPAITGPALYEAAGISSVSCVQSCDPTAIPTPSYYSTTGCAPIYECGKCGKSKCKCNGSTMFTGGVTFVTSSPDNPVLSITSNRPILVDVDESGDNDVFEVDTFENLAELLLNGASTQQDDILAGWVYHNLYIAYGSTTDTFLFSIQVLIEEQRATTYGAYNVLLTIQTEFRRQFAQLSERLIAAMALAMQSAFVDLATLSATIGSSSTFLLPQSLGPCPDGGINGDDLLGILTQVSRRIQTYQNASFALEPAVGIISTTLQTYSESVLRSQLVSTRTLLPVETFAAVTTRSLEQILPALEKILAALQDIDGDMDVDPVVDGTSKIGLFSMWRDIAGANNRYYNTASLNSVWSNYLFYEGTIVDGLLLMMEAYHAPTIPESAKASALMNRYFTALYGPRGFKDLYAPPFPATSANVWMVNDQGQQIYEYGTRNGTTWLVDPPVEGKANLFKYSQAGATAASVTVGGVTGWRLPTPTEVKELVSAKCDDETDQDFLIRLGFGIDVSKQLVVKGLAVLFWTGQGSMVSINQDTGSIQFSAADPDNYAAVFAVRRYE